MAMKIKYIIPEDGDELNHPNFFQLNKTNPTLSDVKLSFPVPGSYHFRFLKLINGQRVWLDLNNENDIIPTYEGNIFAKITRISNVESSSIHNKSKQTTIAQSSNPVDNRASSPPNKPAHRAVPSAAPVQLLDDDDNHYDFSSSPSHAHTSASATHGSFNYNNDDLLDVNNNQTSPRTGTDLFDTVSSTASRPVQATSHSDLFGLETLPLHTPPTHPTPNTSATNLAGMAYQMNNNSLNNSTNNNTNRNYPTPTRGQPSPTTTNNSTVNRAGTTTAGKMGSGSASGGMDAFSGLGNFGNKK